MSKVTNLRNPDLQVFKSFKFVHISFMALHMIILVNVQCTHEKKVNGGLLYKYQLGQTG